ncbi:MerR family transcriptional regulator [Streptacidiphilus sp. ASG 303]|uniref:MerR family transcriptional regulator n=1 Tax=Streptacidiphilus sp. ASG 303 TaxID=2896847 RepID=UPI001E2F4CF9|nr:MerR family transcriptional regulator [Streptacidiphilus sp. ASG 303]MCD0482273.1 MerR family transcriptional regulator [Streptacidiphilus sp. ASG 303]
MELMTIGAFARAARLSPKALRLYDGLGLLPPAHVDPASGYRLYRPEQLERARLVAWLRRLGMPLARIRTVCDLEPAAAAREVAAYWEQVAADTAARQGIAAFLVDHLSGRTTTVADTHTPLTVRLAARSHRGLVRASNQDTAYAGRRLAAVADGMGARGGGLASAAAVGALRPFEDGLPEGDLLGGLAEAVRRADAELRALAAADPGLEGLGTTLTAVLWSGSELALVHIGDTRAYLLRDGGLFLVTHDHTHVQSLVDEERLTPEEAASHPQRALLVRALTGTGDPRPDLSLHAARAGDRYLLCSDGLSTVVAEGELRRVLTGAPDADRAADELVDLAVRRGGPDNVACAVADVLEAAAA